MQYMPLQKAGKISVLVENLEDNAKAVGLTDDQLQTQTELNLRTHHIPVETFPKVSDAALDVQVTIIGPNAHGFYAYTVQLQHWEWVNLLRPEPFGWIAILWNKSVIGVCSVSQLKEAVVSGLGQALDIYANDYLAANEKKP